jgi:hypothetical protein
MLRVLKVLGLAAAAGALKAVSDQAPDLLPPGLGDVVAVAIAAAIAYILPPPKR